MKFKKFLAAVLCAAIAAPAALPKFAFAEENTMDIVIDGSKANLTESMLYRGAGMVSANNTSRLLLDYKAENPDAYWKILNYMFGENGIGINHLKLEMGSDINSSSGTEPAVKRAEDEVTDVTRGAGYQLAADAKTINPDLTLDMLWWSEPKWISDSADVYAARYKWYKETLDAALSTYGLKFDYVSAIQNERAIDDEWIKYLAKQLDSETDTPYDYSAIKIVAADEICGWSMADKMLSDEELMNAIDVIGSHYTSTSSENAQKLAEENGKELWFSEGCSPMSYSKGTYRFDESGSGLNDINGLLDIANRIISMYPQGDMTLYQYQPVVAAYYDGSTYFQKQLIVANEPWSGNFKLDNGFYMSLHFSQFIKKGWAFIDDACFADGQKGGDGHAIVDAVYSYITATDTESGDYSTVITNTTANPITYNFTVSNLSKASSAVDVWETRGPDSGSYDENYFKKTETVTPVENGGKYTYSVTVKPYSLVTVSTVAHEETEYADSDDGESTILSLPYSDDYEYSDYPADYLASRGFAPRYTTDEGGAFEVRTVDGNNVLTQVITPETKAKEWGGTPDPTTNFGDDRWFNYSVSVDVKFDASDAPEKNYVGAGLRYNLSSAGVSGYWLQLYEDGTWNLMKNSKVRESGKLEALDMTGWIKLKIEAIENKVNAYINGEAVAEYTTADISVLSAGRAALYSSYNQNSFDNFAAEPIKDTETYITRFDNTDALCEYTDNWTHTTMGSFKQHKRTSSSGGEGAAVTVSFDGTGFALTGEAAKDTVLSIKLDGEVVDDGFKTSYTGIREISYYLHGLESGSHVAEITVISGTLGVDSVEIVGGALLTAAQIDHAAVTEASDEATASETAAEAGGEASEKPNDIILPIAIAAGLTLAAAATGAVVYKKKKKAKEDK